MADSAQIQQLEGKFKALRHPMAQSGSPTGPVFCELTLVEKYGCHAFTADHENECSKAGLKIFAIDKEARPTGVALPIDLSAAALKSSVTRFIIPGGSNEVSIKMILTNCIYKADDCPASHLINAGGTPPTFDVRVCKLEIKAYSEMAAGGSAMDESKLIPCPGCKKFMTISTTASGILVIRLDGCDPAEAFKKFNEEQGTGGGTIGTTGVKAIVPIDRLKEACPPGGSGGLGEPQFGEQFYMMIDKQILINRLGKSWLGKACQLNISRCGKRGSGGTYPNDYLECYQLAEDVTDSGGGTDSNTIPNARPAFSETNWWNDRRVARFDNGRDTCSTCGVEGGAELARRGMRSLQAHGFNEDITVESVDKFWTEEGADGDRSAWRRITMSGVGRVRGSTLPSLGAHTNRIAHTSTYTSHSASYIRTVKTEMLLEVTRSMSMQMWQKWKQWIEVSGEYDFDEGTYKDFNESEDVKGVKLELKKMYIQTIHSTSAHARFGMTVNENFSFGIDMVLNHSEDQDVRIGATAFLNIKNMMGALGFYNKEDDKMGTVTTHGLPAGGVNIQKDESEPTHPINGNGENLLVTDKKGNTTAPTKYRTAQNNTGWPKILADKFTVRFALEGTAIDSLEDFFNKVKYDPDNEDDRANHTLGIRQIDIRHDFVLTNNLTASFKVNYDPNTEGADHSPWKNPSMSVVWQKDTHLSLKMDLSMESTLTDDGSSISRLKHSAGMYYNRVLISSEPGDKPLFGTKEYPEDSILNIYQPKLSTTMGLTWDPAVPNEDKQEEGGGVTKIFGKNIKPNWAFSLGFGEKVNIDLDVFSKDLSVGFRHVMYSNTGTCEGGCEERPFSILNLNTPNGGCPGGCDSDGNPTDTKLAITAFLQYSYAPGKPIGLSGGIDATFQRSLFKFGDVWGEVSVFGKAKLGFAMGAGGGGTALTTQGFKFSALVSIGAKWQNKFLEFLGFPFNINLSPVIGFGYELMFGATSSYQTKADDPQGGFAFEAALGFGMIGFEVVDSWKAELKRRHSTIWEDCPFLGGWLSKLPILGSPLFGKALYKTGGSGRDGPLEQFQAGMATGNIDGLETIHDYCIRIAPSRTVKLFDHCKIAWEKKLENWRKNDIYYKNATGSTKEILLLQWKQTNPMCDSIDFCVKSQSVDKFLFKYVLPPFEKVAGGGMCDPPDCGGDNMVWNESIHNGQRVLGIKGTFLLAQAETLAYLFSGKKPSNWSGKAPGARAREINPAPGSGGAGILGWFAFILKKIVKVITKKMISFMIAILRGLLTVIKKGLSAIKDWWEDHMGVLPGQDKIWVCVGTNPKNCTLTYLLWRALRYGTHTGYGALAPPDVSYVGYDTDFDGLDEEYEKGLCGAVDHLDKQIMRIHADPWLVAVPPKPGVRGQSTNPGTTKKPAGVAGFEQFHRQTWFTLDPGKWNNYNLEEKVEYCQSFYNHLWWSNPDVEGLGKNKVPTIEGVVPLNMGRQQPGPGDSGGGRGKTAYSQPPGNTVRAPHHGTSAGQNATGVTADSVNANRDDGLQNRDDGNSRACLKCIELLMKVYFEPDRQVIQTAEGWDGMGAFPTGEYGPVKRGVWPGVHYLLREANQYSAGMKIETLFNACTGDSWNDPDNWTDCQVCGPQTAACEGIEEGEEVGPSPAQWYFCSPNEAETIFETRASGQLGCCSPPAAACPNGEGGMKAGTTDNPFPPTCAQGPEARLAQQWQSRLKDYTDKWISESQLGIEALADPLFNSTLWNDPIVNELGDPIQVTFKDHKGATKWAFAPSGGPASMTELRRQLVAMSVMPEVTFPAGEWTKQPDLGDWTSEPETQWFNLAGYNSAKPYEIFWQGYDVKQALLSVSDMSKNGGVKLNQLQNRALERANLNLNFLMAKFRNFLLNQWNHSLIDDFGMNHDAKNTQDPMHNWGCGTMHICGGEDQGHIMRTHTGHWQGQGKLTIKLPAGYKPYPDMVPYGALPIMTEGAQHFVSHKEGWETLKIQNVAVKPWWSIWYGTGCGPTGRPWKSLHYPGGGDATTDYIDNPQRYISTMHGLITPRCRQDIKSSDKRDDRGPDGDHLYQGVMRTLNFKWQWDRNIYSAAGGIAQDSMSCAVGKKVYEENTMKPDTKLAGNIFSGAWFNNYFLLKGVDLMAHITQWGGGLKAIANHCPTTRVQHAFGWDMNDKKDGVGRGQSPGSSMLMPDGRPCGGSSGNPRRPSEFWRKAPSPGDMEPRPHINYETSNSSTTSCGLGQYQNPIAMCNIDRIFYRKLSPPILRESNNTEQTAMEYGGGEYWKNSTIISRVNGGRSCFRTGMYKSPYNADGDWPANGQHWGDDSKVGGGIAKTGAIGFGMPLAFMFCHDTGENENWWDFSRHMVRWSDDKIITKLTIVGAATRSSGGGTGQAAGSTSSTVINAWPNHDGYAKFLTQGAGYSKDIKTAQGTMKYLYTIPGQQNINRQNKTIHGRIYDFCNLVSGSWNGAGLFEPKYWSNTWITKDTHGDTFELYKRFRYMGWEQVSMINKIQGSDPYGCTRPGKAGAQIWADCHWLGVDCDCPTCEETQFT